MAWTVQQKTVKDGNGVAFPLDIVGDGVNFVELGVVYDPNSGKWAAVDAASRIAALADLHDPATGFIAGIDSTLRLKSLADIHDPVSGAIAAIDATSKRLATSASQATEVTVGQQYGFAVSTVSSSTLTIPGGATHAWVTVDPDSAGTGRLRYTKDGATVPTATIGHTLEFGDSILLSNLANLKFFAQGGAVTIQVTYVHF